MRRYVKNNFRYSESVWLRVKHLSPFRETALTHRSVATHRIGLLSVTLRSDIVALLRKKIEFVKKSARAEKRNREIGSFFCYGDEENATCLCC